MYDRYRMCAISFTAHNCDNNQSFSLWLYGKCYNIQHWIDKVQSEGQLS